MASLLTATLTITSPAAAAVDDGLLLRYKLDETSGAVATDASGHGRDGTVTGAGWTGGTGLTFNGTSTYVKAPDDLLADLDAVTVAFDVKIDSAQATPYFLYGFGNTDASTGYGNGYLFATGDSFRAAISLSNWSGEQNTRPATGYNLTRNAWKHIAYTQSGTTGTLYEDGVVVATNTAISILPSAIGSGTTRANYFGRSLYTGDRYLKGGMRDIRVYDRALAADEVNTLATPVNESAVAADRQALDLGGTTALTANLSLPATAANGSKLTWSSSDPSVITAAGRITRPPAGRPDAQATLTATIRRGTVQATKDFAITVRAELDDAAAAEAAAKTLQINNLDDVRGNLALPSSASGGTTVSWSSGDPAVISASGEVHRPAHGAGTTTVTLTATVTKGSATATRAFTAKVPELPAQEPYQGYLFSYFTGEGYANGEQIYHALSNGNDPLSWREINKGQPVLTSTLGTQGLRDPFIIRSPEGDKFYQIATDLKIYGNGDWDASQRSGSKSLMVWESTDLVTWTNQRLVKVSPDTAGNTWAPEAFYSRELGSYVVFWASKIYDETDTGHTGTTYNKMMYATTRDFYTFSEPRVWKDPGYSVIDSTMVEHDGQYYRFTKDERNNSSSSPCSKYIIEEKSTDVLDLDYDFVSECIGSPALSRGEGPLIFKSNTEDKWYLFIDEYGGRGYVPFSTTDLNSGKWTAETKYTLPSRPRHGTVLPVTRAEYDRISAKYEEPPPALGGVTVPQLKVDAIIDRTAGTVKLPVVEGTDVTALAPRFTLAEGATISPASGTPRDFSAPVTYELIGKDGVKRTWTVSALVMKSPVLPGLNADPNITVFGDTFWMYPTTDGFAGWSGTQFHAFSSKDLVHWTDHGVILDLGPDVSWADNSAWAPTVAERNGKYYFYFSGGAASGNTAKQLGVAVADNPAGPFTDALGKPLVAAGSYSGQMIDSAVFTDDDGKSYLYWGNGNSYQVPLNDDMVSFDPALVRTYHPANYNEGSFVIKRNGTYYFMWSENDTRSADYRVAYATGSSPVGPWSDRVGVILSKDASLGILGTGHHSVVRLPGSDDWYVAYHRFAIPGGDGTHRETTIDRLTFDASGRIEPVVPTLESVDPVTVTHAGADISGAEGGAIPVGGTVSNSANRPTWSWTAGDDVDAGATCDFAEAQAAATTVTCTDDGTYTITLAAGGSRDSAVLRVGNVSPNASAPSSPVGPAPTGKEVRVDVPVADRGANDSLTCAASWGDGSSSAGTVRSGGCVVTHTYSAGGVFQPAVTVRDDDGTATTVTVPRVVTYVAGGGQAAGSGTLTAPAGCLDGIRAGGTVEFAFNAGSPGGSTWLRFATGDLDFRSTSQTAPLILGNTATYSGSGTVNGGGSYRFLVTAIDGTDRLAVRIWDARTGRTVFNVPTLGAARVTTGGIVVSPKKHH
ncbi:hypothetical protein Acy02nite_15840 [Actinoplanes cyaneus]|uniref:PKD domain-containing protein n=1 Tax=Actinoplanes cyaneus TaxID=52696 RepID=A0A919IHT6_9ACTN|nr:family 43 glycosylhydrolase [Actinoplanes cyaneus]GID63703.1 hypothetical protein Acy02nite_15840 [Actinoplanes cyaneus]